MKAIKNKSTTQGAAFTRIWPVCLALSPIGLLFGVLAAQVDWGAWEVLLMALLGFTGSGQFAYLGFAHPDNARLEYLTLFLIILGINLRYLPMTLSASAPLPGGGAGGVLRKALLAHWLADESYAVERKQDGIMEKAVIRLSVVACWALSTTAGVLLAAALPPGAREMLAGLTFPISAILILLSWDNIAAFIAGGGQQKWRALAACAAVSALGIALMGPKYFWLPSIACCYWIFIRFAPAGHADE